MNRTWGQGTKSPSALQSLYDVLLVLLVLAMFGKALYLVFGPGEVDRRGAKIDPTPSALILLLAAVALLTWVFFRVRDRFRERRLRHERDTESSK